jgi:hypothetical protein
MSEVMAKRTRKQQQEATPEPAAARPPESELDREIAEDFQERQNLSEEGRDQLARKLRDHHQLSPVLSAGDVDAAWDTARESGEETFTGHAPTPDQDRVDEMGAAAGLTYKDDEPLQYGKVAKRDERRWELDPRSGQEEQAMEEDADDEDDEDDAADADDAPLRFWDLADDLDAEVDEEEDDEDDDEDEDEEADEEDTAVLADDELEVDEAEIDADEDEDEEDDTLGLGVDDDELDSDLDDDLEEDELDDEDDEDDD